MLTLRNDSRTAVIGKNGSGKSTFGAWLLSGADFDRRPWIVLDYKADPIFETLLRQKSARLVKIGWRPSPADAGIYIVRPRLDDQTGVETMLGDIWQACGGKGKLKKGVGIWLDEAMRVPNTRPLQSMLLQGRSKKIQMINLVQRPVEVPREIFSEAEYFAIFSLNDQRDRMTVARFAPTGDRTVPRDHSCLWYDSYTDELSKVLPVPSASVICDRIGERAVVTGWW